MAKDNDKKQDDAAPAVEEGAELLRKISPKTVMGSRVKIPEKPTVLYRVIGYSHGVKIGSSDNGPFVAFLGTFEATRMHDGKVFQSGQCFVPKAVEDLLLSSMRAGQKEDASASIQFAIEVGVKPSDLAVGYEYTVKNLIKTANADPLLAMREQLKALPAPAPAK